MELVELRNAVLRHRLVRALNPPPLPEDVDDALNFIQRDYIQPVALYRVSVEYTTTVADETVILTSLATDIYRFRFVLDVTGDTTAYSYELPFWSENEPYLTGIRLFGDKLYLQNVAKGRKLRFHYDKTLKELGVESGQVRAPEIEARWHDLYRLGAIWELTGDQLTTEKFFDRLEAFTRERERAENPSASKQVKIVRAFS